MDISKFNNVDVHWT